ncbi:class I histocompatibility antigen, F10 alpha chain-like [Pygocentrus nattereri]|uniref:class I histocompatibility antigen, F10 alpha chain-like n=1 Tax=Pygocentrus nattereri TaxID=42514 RepID=UPI001891D1E1|nr:class I histocompatibility antigen, F10 alpha chain-like [Pygocentrus nattereri]
MICTVKHLLIYIVKSLLLLSVSVHLTSAASHSLRYISTAITPGTPFPQYTVVGLVDGEPLMVYDSNVRKMTPKTECLEKSEGEDFWNSESEIFKDEQRWSLSNMDTTMKRHNNTQVSPEVSLFQKDSSSPVVCHATGFFPKAVLISWQKNGKDLHEDVELRETLPNQDGTFQKRSVLTVSPEELDRHNYTCIIQHSSLEKKMILTVSDHRVLPNGGLGGVLVGAIIAILLFILICVGVFIWKKKKQSLTETHHPTTPQSSG